MAPDSNYRRFAMGGSDFERFRLILPILSFSLLGLLQTPEAEPTKPVKQEERAEILERARRILEQSQSLEITTAEARRKVELLLKGLKAWSEAYDEKLTPRTRTFTSPSVKDKSGLLGTDTCPIFFGEQVDELCPLDQARSEVWGAEVLFCRYLCSR